MPMAAVSVPLWTIQLDVVSRSLCQDESSKKSYRTIKLIIIILLLYWV